MLPAIHAAHLGTYAPRLRVGCLFLHSAIERKSTNRQFGLVACYTQGTKAVPYERQKVILAIALVLGLLLAFVDSRPNCDDTGIIAFAMLISGGVIGLFVKRRPWLFALALGAWIPLWGVIVTHNFGSLLALVLAFAGVYAGWAYRLVIMKAHSQA